MEWDESLVTQTKDKKRHEEKSNFMQELTVIPIHHD